MTPAAPSGGSEAGRDTSLVKETDAHPDPATGAPVEFCWASETGSHGMIRVEEAERDGWVKAIRHPWWRCSWLMKRTGGGATCISQ